MYFAVLTERHVTPLAVNGDSQYFRILLMEKLQGSTVQGHLVAANRTPVGRIKGKDHALSFKVGQLQFLIGRGIQFKVGVGNSFLKFHEGALRFKIYDLKLVTTNFFA